MSNSRQSAVVVGRRKALKTIVGGVTALATYNALPSKWGTPIIEQMFLPAHAATSGDPAPTPTTIDVTLSVTNHTDSGVVSVTVDSTADWAAGDFWDLMYDTNPSTSSTQIFQGSINASFSSSHRNLGQTGDLNFWIVFTAASGKSYTTNATSSSPISVNVT